VESSTAKEAMMKDVTRKAREIEKETKLFVHKPRTA
jgi:hypothetical protein